LVCSITENQQLGKLNKLNKLNKKKMNRLSFLLLVFALLTISCSQHNISWTIVLKHPGYPDREIVSFNDLPRHDLAIQKTVDGIRVNAHIQPKKNLVLFHAKASSDSLKKCFLSIEANYSDGTVYSYNGEVKSKQVFRQSPHDPGIYNLQELVKQAVPMIAVKTKNGFVGAISDSPAFYDNYTTQTFDPAQKLMFLSSGDDGKITGSKPSKIQIHSYYHRINKNKSHTFNGIIFQSNATEMNSLRRDVLKSIAQRWGKGINDRFGATAFSTNYMLLRKNETGKSQYWVVPGIEYANKQYSRDAFWQSMVLPKEYSRECYRNEALAQSQGAERPLFCMIWAYRNKLEGGETDMQAARQTLLYINTHTRNGWYYSNNDPKKKDFQSWYDLAAFEDNDVITYNQGLFAVALLSAEALGLKPSSSSDQAIRNYRSMYNEKGGYYPLSQQKDLLSVDPLVGDLLSQVLFNRTLLNDDSVQSHFRQLSIHAKTAYGFKVTCLPNGDYAPIKAYGAKNFKIHWVKEPGKYIWGGSYYLYDMLFLMDSYLHEAIGASDEIIWRGTLDFKKGGTYFEHINTATGKLGKKNQGWNGAIYALWKNLMDKGKIDSSLIEAVDKL